MSESGSTSGAHALVFGASGLAGWAVVNELLSNYPNEGTFSRVTALVNRPLAIEASHWPPPSSSRPRLGIVSHVNLMEGIAEDLASFLKDKVGGIEDVTHVYYFAAAYKEGWNPDTEIKTNCDMLERTIGAVEKLCPGLKFVVFPSGTRGYGIYNPGGNWIAPLKESMQPSADAEGDKTFYPIFARLLTKWSTGKSWTWCEVRPDAIIGFAPHGSAFNIVSHWALYLSTRRLVNGPNSKVPYPGNSEGYHSLFTEASADTIARLSIWASLHPSASSGELFNVADSATPGSMAQRWPQICAFFGLEGVGPTSNEDEMRPGEYVKKYGSVLEENGFKTDIVGHPGFLDLYGYQFTFDRQLSLEKVRTAGFTEEFDPKRSWEKAFERLKGAGMIP